MNKSISFNDVANLSACLDNQLSQSEKTRLEKRIKEQPDLEDFLADLRETKELLQKTPRRRAPRNFTLTPKMAGIKPPVPRLVPAFSWSSAVAMLLFVFTLGANLVGRYSFSMADRIASAPPGYGMGGGPPAAEGPYPEAAPEDSSLEVITTPETMLMALPEETAVPGERSTEAEQDMAKEPAPQASPWLVIWPVLAGVLVGAALFLRWISIRKFKQKNRP